MQNRNNGVGRVGAKVGFYGQKIIHVIASVYPTVTLATVEATKNAIDAKAKRVQVVIDLHGGGKKDRRVIAVRDNGSGMTVEKFDREMEEVGKSEKAGDASQLGEHGLGVMSFAGKANSYNLTTAPKEGKGAAGWIGYTRHYMSGMYQDGNDLIIPRDPDPDLTKKPEWWNTEVSVSDFQVPLRVSLDAIEEAVRSDCNLAMLKHGTEIDLLFTDARGKTTVRKIGGRQFVGQAFKRFSKVGQHCGRVQIEMYRLANLEGDVVLRTASSLATKSWRNVRQAALESGMRKENAEALSTGYFEGVVTIEKIGWAFDRQSFKSTDESAWTEVLLILEEWMDTEDVRKFLAAIRETKESSRENVLLKRLSDYFSQLRSRNQDLLYDALLQLGSAAVSAGHTELPDGERRFRGRTLLPQGGRIIRTEEDEQPRGRRGDKGPAKKERQLTHFGVVDDKGNTRFVSKSQLGISFALASIGSMEPFQWNLHDGILVINRDHPFYQEIRDQDTKVWAYLLGITEWAVCVIHSDEGANEAFRESLQQMQKQHMRFLVDKIGQM